MRFFIALFLFETVFGLPTLSTAQAAEAPVFSFHLQNEPHSVDPARLTSTDASFFFPQLYRGLYRYNDKKGLIAEGAKSCKWATALKIICELDPKTQWSDGSQVVAEDYIRSFQHLLETNSRSPAIELLTNVENAPEVFGGKAPKEKLGVSAVAPLVLEIRFAKPDPDFLYKLTSPVLVPVKRLPFPDRTQSKDLIVNGPYKVAEWIQGHRVRLEPNLNYKSGHKLRPPVEVFFILEDSTALLLYRQGRMKMLRRLPIGELPAWKNKADLTQTAVARFDYIGFGPELEDLPELRKAFALGIDYLAYQRLLEALGRPGCPSLPDSYMTKPPCHSTNLKAAKAAWAKLPEDVRNKRHRLFFSALGGDDIKRSAEFLQNQWVKNLGAKVDLEQTENGVFLSTLRTSPPSIFRKGVGLDRPTCLSALEVFQENGSENFIRLKDAKYEDIVQKLSLSTNETQKKRLCTEGVSYLVSNYRLIPLGRIHFTYLVQPEFKGWDLNEMNQLDLSGLHVVKRAGTK